MSEIPSSGIAIRRAIPHQIPAIRAMQERSFAVLGVASYTPEVIAAFVAAFGTMDDAVVDEGHYFVASTPTGAILATAGWSERTPGYDRTRLRGPADQHGPGEATVRSVFVDPSVARRGIASALMRHVETDAARHGIRMLRLMATLSGVAFYKRLGWRSDGAKTIALPGGMEFACLSMSKRLTSRVEAPQEFVTQVEPA